VTARFRLTNRRWQAGAAATVLLLAVLAGPRPASAGFPWKGLCCHKTAGLGCAAETDVGGEWYWLRSPEQERRVIISHYNRYCVRCHGVDGRGVWDIPDVPDFSNGRWQATRSDAQLARATLEGRGAVMPPFRGTLTLEEAWAMARYIRTFVPGTEQPRPDRGGAEPKETGAPAKPEEKLPAPMPK
jgi:mono/diheme cytochrome c family protein